MEIVETEYNNLILDLHQKIFGNDFPVEKYVKKVENDQQIRFFLLKTNLQAVGYCAVVDDSTQMNLHPWVGGVLPTYQGKGYFTEFYDEIIQYAEKNHYLSVTSNTDNYKPHMISILIKKGFNITGVQKTPYGDGVGILFEYKIFPPFALRINLTNDCNFNCFFCHHDGVQLKDRTSLEIPKLEKILVQAKKINCDCITLSGGEPMLSWNAVKYVIKYCNDWSRRPVLKIVTNGSLWNEEMAAELGKYQGDISVNLSLHGLNETVLRKISKVGMARTNYIHIVQLLNTYEIKFRINCVLLKNVNSDETAFLDMIMFSLSHYVKKITFMELLVMETDHILQPFYISLEEIIQIFECTMHGRFCIELVSKTRKKVVYTLTDKECKLEVVFFRLSCRVGCDHCLENKDHTIGADGRCYPCYLDPSYSCGDAVENLENIIKSGLEFSKSQSWSENRKKLFWR